MVFVSIVLGSVRICPRRPEQGNTSSGHAFDLIGIPPLPGSLRGALIGCDGSRRFLYRFNARPVTGRKYHYCFCILWPSVRMRRTVRLKRSCGSSALADGRRKVKDALYYSVFKERAEAIEKAPSLFMVKSEGAYNRNFYFSKRFLSFTLILVIRLLIAC